jgi:succinyl-CoA synthetase beta subunit
MNVHEFQAKALLKRYGVTVPAGREVVSPEDAAKAAHELGGSCVVKAQIHAGGRGKAGGVKVCHSPEEAEDFARGLLGRKLVTHQTGPAGREVKRLLAEAASDIDRELYLGMVVDRGTGRPAMMASAEGGVEIEEVAARSPEKILREGIDPAVGLQPFQARKLAFGIGIPKDSVGKAVKFMTALYRAFVDTDASMAEINPLVLTAQGDLIALDAKMGFDDNALFRHPEVRELRDLNEGIGRRSRRPSSISATSPSTATSVAWSTGRASPWRRWTSSNTSAGSRRTFSTSAAERPPRR